MSQTQYVWTPLTVAGSGGNYLFDPPSDQQTGQGEDDFVSVSGTMPDPGFLIRAMNLAGNPNGPIDAVGFRFVLNKTNQAGTYTGLTSIGMDVDLNGSLDIVFTAVGKQQGNGLNWQAPGNDLNVSPNTTSLGNLNFITGFTTTGATPNFNYQPASNVYVGWGEGDPPTQIGGTVDYALTFALTFTQINDALHALNAQNAPLGKPTYADLTASSLVRFIAFTSTQSNAINQDIYGSNGISGAVRFDAPGGGFSEYTDFTGRPVPEPSTLVAVAALLGSGMWLRRRRQRAAGLTAGGKLRPVTG